MGITNSYTNTPPPPPEKIESSKTRYFLASTVGVNPNSSYGFNTIDIKTTIGHPTAKRIIELTNERFPGMRDLLIISICEFSEKDWKVFISEQ